MSNLSLVIRVGLALAIGAACATHARAQQLDEPDFAIEYSGSPAVPVITYHVETAIESDDQQPLLRVYGDGRVHVHKPWHNRDAGDYQFNVSEDEMASLLESLQENGVMTYDAKSVAQQRQTLREQRLAAARAGQLVLTHNSDPEVVVVRVELETYRPSRTADPTPKFSKEVRCPNLRREAEELPEIEAMQGMARVDEALQGYVNDARLRRIAEGASR
jgi:hypothetical protein